MPEGQWTIFTPSLFHCWQWLSLWNLGSWQHLFQGSPFSVSKCWEGTGEGGPSHGQWEMGWDNLEWVREDAESYSQPSFIPEQLRVKILRFRSLWAKRRLWTLFSRCSQVLGASVHLSIIIIIRGTWLPHPFDVMCVALHCSLRLCFNYDNDRRKFLLVEHYFAVGLEIRSKWKQSS